MLDFAKLTRRGLLGTTMLALAAPKIASASPSYRNAQSPTGERVRDLMSQMTLEEKAAQLRSMWETKVGFLDESRRFSETKAAAVIGHGIGQIARISDIRGYPEWVVS